MVHISFWFMLMMLVFGGSVHTIKKNTVALEAASKKTGLEVNADNMSCLEIRIKDELKI